MKFAFVSTMEGSPWGGSELLWSQAAIELQRRGHQVVASVRNWPTIPEPVQELRRQGIQVFFRRPFPLVLTGLSKAIDLEWRLEFFRKQYWLRRVSADLVCYSNGGTGSGLSAMNSCKSLGLPYCVIGQANFEGWWPTDLAASELREIYSESKKCFFVSRANLLLFEKQIGMQLTNAQIISNPFAVPWDAAPPWPNVPGPNDEWSVACVARLEPAAKGQDLLLEVLALPQWSERKLRVTFFGDGSNRECLERLAERFGVTDRVKFAGYVPEPLQIWKSHHCLVLPSRYEGLPLAVVEAMLCGRPVIATAVAGIPEVVEDSVTGFLAAAPTVSLLADAMERAWEQRYNWSQIGTAAQHRIRQMIPKEPSDDFATILEELCRI
jgi:glycosyltransferase involved in cell wall biosynthesis